MGGVADGVWRILAIGNDVLVTRMAEQAANAQQVLLDATGGRVVIVQVQDFHREKASGGLGEESSGKSQKVGVGNGAVALDKAAAR